MVEWIAYKPSIHWCQHTFYFFPNRGHLHPATSCHHSKRLCPSSSLFFSLQVTPCGPVWCAMPPTLWGIVSNKIFSQRQLTPFLSSYHTRLKQMLGTMARPKPVGWAVRLETRRTLMLQNPSWSGEGLFRPSADRMVPICIKRGSLLHSKSSYLNVKSHLKYPHRNIQDKVWPHICTQWPGQIDT